MSFPFSVLPMEFASEFRSANEVESALLSFLSTASGANLTLPLYPGFLNLLIESSVGTVTWASES